MATGIYNWAMTLPASFSQLYAIFLGADPMVLGLLSSFSNLAGVLTSIPVGWFMAKYGLKPVLIGGFLTLAISALAYAVAGEWSALIPAVVLAGVSPALTFPVADIVIVEATGRGSRATAIGVSRVVWSLFSLAAPPAATLIVASFGGLSAEGIRPLFVVQMAVLIAGAALLYLHLSDGEQRARSRASFREVVNSLRLLFRGRSAAWFLAMATQRFSMAMAFSFLPLWAVTARGADEYTIGAMNSAGLAASIASSTVAGALADRKGWFGVFLATRSLTYAGTLIAFLLPRRDVLVLAGALGIVGYAYGAGASSFIPFITAFWEAAPAEHRGAWYAASSLLGGLVATGAPIIGGAVWELGYRDAVLLLPMVVDALGLVAAWRASRPRSEA